jgi:hypothetical protein
MRAFIAPDVVTRVRVGGFAIVVSDMVCHLSGQLVNDPDMVIDQTGAVGTGPAKANR